MSDARTKQQKLRLRVDRGTKLRAKRERELVAGARAPITGCRRIAVVSPEGGAGKTTTTLNLGHTFARHRADRVIALGANSDAGSLGYRVRRETRKTITDLVGVRDAVARYADIHSFHLTSAVRTRGHRFR